VSTLDLVPTLLGMLGVEPPPDLDGRDLRRDWPGRQVFSAWKQHSAVRSGDWKLLGDWKRLHAQRPTALYRIADDPLETRNRLGEGLPEETELTAALREFLDARAELVDQNERIYGRLRALGYVD
jgi:arylsulfatase A-like enzyme